MFGNSSFKPARDWTTPAKPVPDAPAWSIDGKPSEAACPISDAAAAQLQFGKGQSALAAQKRNAGEALVGLSIASSTVANFLPRKYCLPILGASGAALLGAIKLFGDSAENSHAASTATRGALSTIAQERQAQMKADSEGRSL